MLNCHICCYDRLRLVILIFIKKVDFYHFHGFKFIKGFCTYVVFIVRIF